MKPTIVRRGLLGVLVATAFSGAGAAALIGPAATAASDPCAASEVAKTAGSVATSTGDYLDAHPQINQTLTAILQQPAGQSMASLKTYFDANPKIAGDLQALSSPLAGLSTRCKLPISIPQMLGFMQGAQGQGGFPGLPAVPSAPSGPLPSPTPPSGVIR